MAVGTFPASVFDADLPALGYEQTETPAEIYPRIQAAQQPAGAPAILTFGGGIHYCVGANLARRELAEPLNAIAARLVNPRIAGPVPWKPMVSLSGPTSLPIEFDTQR